MGRALRLVLVVVGIAAMGMAASGNAGAAVTTQTAMIPVAAVQPARGDIVGVAHPVEVTFAKPIADRAAAERAIDITSTKPMTGRFTWLNDNVVQWNPDGFWPAHSGVNVKVGPAFSTDFHTGAAVVGVADISAHTFTVSIGDEVVRQMPASMGKSGFATPQGKFSVMAKERTVIMDSRTLGIPLSDPEGYRLNVEYAVRITSGGVYVHSAPWSTGSQGYANVSHGCINLSPDNAAWYFNQVRVGDPVTVQA